MNSWCMGRDGAAALSATSAVLEFHKFAPAAIFDAPAGLVIGVIDLDVTLKKTGVHIGIPDEEHLFFFNATGKVVKFARRLDTHQFWRALQATLARKSGRKWAASFASCCHKP